MSTTRAQYAKSVDEAHEALHEASDANHLAGLHGMRSGAPTTLFTPSALAPRASTARHLTPRRIASTPSFASA